MSSQTRRLIRWSTQSRQWLMESWSLSKKLLYPIGRQPWRQACLELTQQENNQLARFVLEFDKEIHLLRYHGFWKYLDLQQQQHQQQQHRHPWAESLIKIRPYLSRDYWIYGKKQPSLPPTTTSGTTSSFTTSSSTTTTKAATTTATKEDSSTNDDHPRMVVGVVAKIPFLITTAMREQLKALGYTLDQIKHFTPLQATLLLKHQVVANENTPLKLAELLQIHHQQQQQQQDPHHHHHPLESTSSSSTPSQPPPSQPPPSQPPPSQPTSPSQQTQPSQQTLSSQKVPSQQSNIISPSSKWYQVLEEEGQDSDLVVVVVGLHRTLEQAQQDCSLRQELAKRNNSSRKFKIQLPTTKDSSVVVVVAKK